MSNSLTRGVFYALVLVAPFWVGLGTLAVKLHG
jgi:hypothetical protein